MIRAPARCSGGEEKEAKNILNEDYSARRGRKGFGGGGGGVISGA